MPLCRIHAACGSPSLNHSASHISRISVISPLSTRQPSGFSPRAVPCPPDAGMASSPASAAERWRVDKVPPRPRASPCACAPTLVPLRSPADGVPLLRRRWWRINGCEAMGDRSVGRKVSIVSVSVSVSGCGCPAPRTAAPRAPAPRPEHILTSPAVTARSGDRPQPPDGHRRRCRRHLPPRRRSRRLRHCITGAPIPTPASCPSPPASPY